MAQKVEGGLIFFSFFGVVNVMNIYVRKTLKNQNFFQRLCRKLPAENGLIEIHNLFAENQTCITSISVEQVDQIAQKYKFNIAKKFKKERIELFESYLDYCLLDKKIDVDNLVVLNHIRDILQLDRKDTEDLMQQKAQCCFEAEVSKLLSGGVCTDETKTVLEGIADDLQLSEKVAQETFATVAQESMQRYLAPIIEAERLSPGQEIELYAFAKSLGGVIDGNLQSKLNRYKQYWHIEHGDLPTLIPDINLQKSENLYFTTRIDWLEYRKVSKGVNYAGPTARIKIAKGLYFRAGSLRTQPISADELKVIDSGQLYLTDKRLIFVGTKGNKTIKINKILTINPYNNGVDIQKDTGKSPFLQFDTDVDIFSMTLVRLMNDA